MSSNKESSDPAPIGPGDGRDPASVQGSVEARQALGEPLHLVLDDISDFAIFMLGLDGKIASWNTGAQRLKGYTAQEAIGQPFGMLFTEEDVEGGKPQREMEYALSHGVYSGEGKRLKKDGSTFDADVTLRLMVDAGGKPKAFVKVTRDISERKRLLKLQEDRALFEKQLLGIVSHDLRNPLNAIMMSAALLQTRAGLDARQVHAIERISTSAQRALRLVRELLDFTQARLAGALSVALSTVDVDGLMHEAVDELQIVYPDRELQAQIQAHGRAELDGDRMAQMLSNLVSNAVKHGAPDKPITLRSEAVGDDVAFSVHNWGAPIPEELKSTIFDPLTQASSRRQSTGSIGFGLFIVKHIADAHRGTVAVTSSQQAGTTFTVRLPRRSHTSKSSS